MHVLFFLWLPVVGRYSQTISLSLAIFSYFLSLAAAFSEYPGTDELHALTSVTTVINVIIFIIFSLKPLLYQSGVVRLLIHLLLILTGIIILLKYRDREFSFLIKQQNISLNKSPKSRIIVIITLSSYKYILCFINYHFHPPCVVKLFYLAYIYSSTLRFSSNLLFLLIKMMRILCQIMNTTN